MSLYFYRCAHVKSLTSPTELAEKHVNLPRVQHLKYILHFHWTVLDHVE